MVEQIGFSNRNDGRQSSKSFTPRLPRTAFTWRDLSRERAGTGGSRRRSGRWYDAKYSNTENYVVDNARKTIGFENIGNVRPALR